jgi:hypothetical protein
MGCVRKLRKALAEEQDTICIRLVWKTLLDGCEASGSDGESPFEGLGSIRGEALDLVATLHCEV